MIAEAVFFLCGLGCGLAVAAFFANQCRKLHQEMADLCGRVARLSGPPDQDEVARQRRKRTMWPE